MPTYNYTARDPKTGKKLSATIQADNEQVCCKATHRQGLSPMDIRVTTRCIS